MENTKNRTLLITTIVVLVLVIGLIVWMVKKPTPLVDQNAVVPPVTTTPESTEDLSAGSVNAGVPAASISYANALIKYKNARLQLDSKCNADAQSQNMTFKNGASLMIDNRAPSTRTVKVGSTFTIKSYGFKIVKLQSATVPATWMVNCDAAKNIATILIQK